MSCVTCIGSRLVVHRAPGSHPRVEVLVRRVPHRVHQRPVDGVGSGRLLELHPQLAGAGGRAAPDLHHEPPAKLPTLPDADDGELPHLRRIGERHPEQDERVQGAVQAQPVRAGQVFRRAEPAVLHGHLPDMICNKISIRR